MIELNELSGIGLGSHHLNTTNPDHLNAVIKALNSGCKIIDTSSNYQLGMAEQLLGEALKNIDPSNYFLMSKGGGISNEILKVFTTELKDLIPAKEIVHVSDQFYHSIHPIFLENQLSNSLKVMNQTYLDGYFLHNPEYYLQSEGSNEEEYYRRIKKAFEYLEEEVIKGRIRYFGISDSSGETNIQRLIDIAESISSNHHFKLVQFPFNVLEKGILGDSERKNNLELLHENGIVTFGNRPFTAKIDGNSYRLVNREISSVEKQEVLDAMDQAFYTFENYAESLPSAVDISESPIVQYIYNGWEEFNDETVFDVIYSNYLLPYMYSLSKSTPDEALLSDMEKMADAMRNYLRDVVTKRSRALMTNSGHGELFDAPDGDAQLCAVYLSEGIDVVLCGMKRPKYVERLMKLF